MTEIPGNRDIGRLLVAVPRYVVGIIMIIVTVLINIEVALRFFFNLPLDAISELILLLFPWMSLLGAAVALETVGANVTLSILDSRLGRRGKMWIHIFVSLSAFVFSTFMVTEGMNYAAMTSDELTNVLAISMNWDTAAFPVAGALFAIYSLYSIVRTLRRGEAGASGVIAEPF